MSTIFALLHDVLLDVLLCRLQTELYNAATRLQPLYRLKSAATISCYRGPPAHGESLITIVIASYCHFLTRLVYGEIYAPEQ